MDKKVKEFSEKEKKLMDLEYEFITNFIKLRKELNMSQQKLADSADVIRETIARIETRVSSPQINTLIKILEPVGYTIDIVPLKKEKKKKAA